MRSFTAAAVCLIAPALALPGAVSLPEIGLPIADLTRADLHDMFAEARRGHLHRAIDLMRPKGTPVMAAVPGTIRKLHRCKLGGITIYEFDEAGEYCYYYAHLDHYADGLCEGMHVEPGDTIAYVGSTGNATAAFPHLHFAIFKLGPQKQWWRGRPIDPYQPLVAAVKRANEFPPPLTAPTPLEPARTPLFDR